MYLDRESRPPITPQLAVRVAIIGGVALVLFAVVFFRLWYLQVLSGDKYKAEANNNRVREVTVQAPRGRILDRNGRVLVDNRYGLAVTISPDKLPKDPHKAAVVYRRLAPLLHMTGREIRRTVNKQLKAVPFSPAIVKDDVPQATYSYILENHDRFPPVDVEQLAFRKYPYREVGAHLFGTVGEVTAKELKQDRYRGVKQGDRVGQSGIEYSYDRYLRGKDGARRVSVDALGNARQELAERVPKPGRQLRLGVDFDLQKVGQQAIQGDNSAFVVMDVKTGEVRAMGSNPSFDPNIFAKTIKESDYKRLSNPLNGAPLTNRATQGLYPTGSTFKLITATAALEGGLITPDTVEFDGGSLKVGGITFKNAGGAVNGALALRRALQVSSDVFFYRMGLEANGAGDGHLIQRWARRLGLGRRTGIDLPGENAGLIPSPEWRNRLFKKHLTDRPWSVGDNINLAVGQGDVQVDPLQLAVAYAAIANGGYVVKPHLGQRVEDSVGRVIQEFRTPARRKLPLDPAYRQAIMDGLYAAANSPGGTSYPVFKDFRMKICGKTGTAQKGLGRADQSWYAAMAPCPNPRFVVVATFEHGGFGATTAAPAVRKILSELFGLKDKGPTRGSTAGVNPFG
ncbi:MAG: penicillin-binding protein 2 [Thermoleophilaceae bacterium]|nr:penicillin-binding protein 2 [Thermoleophilaceae bacterium]MEA2351908.1 penicillin-binding protein 2 [Thermoleophilaceae bacterium]MEA2388029.1 penicillin-binding protein 2 [Thermoleophilaceae bacterium]